MLAPFMFLTCRIVIIVFMMLAQVLPRRTSWVHGFRSLSGFSAFSTIAQNNRFNKAIPSTEQFYKFKKPNLSRIRLSNARFSTNIEHVDNEHKAIDCELTKHLAQSMGFEINDNCDSNTVKQNMIRHLMKIYHNKQHVPRDFIDKLLNYSIKTHLSLPNIISVDRNKTICPEGNIKFTNNLTIVGDTHGQYEDFSLLLEDHEYGLFPSDHNMFIFNGDMVDRGLMGLEIVTVLLFAKLLYPNSIHILRGNHETPEMTLNYGFYKEVKYKYDNDIYVQFLKYFNTLPLGAVVNKDAFVVHGGIGPCTVNMNITELNELDRFVDTNKHHQAITELLWSGINLHVFSFQFHVLYFVVYEAVYIYIYHLCILYTMYVYNYYLYLWLMYVCLLILDPRDKMQGFKRNSGRGGGTLYFGSDVTEAFLARNNLQLLIRSHEVAMQGYQVLHNNTCITVFSAPNYCGDTGNVGAIIRYSDENSNKHIITQFPPAAWLKAKRLQDNKDKTSSE